jgi:5-methylcytosine-specific restriction endonuclease McrA
MPHNFLNNLQNEWNDLIAKYRSHCAYCGKVFAKLVRDHVIPVSKGGSDNITNIAPSCVSCNSAKKDRLIQPKPYSVFKPSVK